MNYFGSIVVISMSLAFAKEEVLNSYSFSLHTYYSKIQPHDQVQREFVTLHVNIESFVKREVRTEWKN